MAGAEFIAWADRHRGEVTVVRNLMAEPLSDQPVQLRGQLVQMEAWNARMTTLLAHAEGHLAEAECRELDGLVESKEPTSEKKIRIRMLTRHERRVRDTIKGLCGAMECRAMMGMSLIKAHNSERMAGHGV